MQSQLQYQQRREQNNESAATIKNLIEAAVSITSKD